MIRHPPEAVPAASVRGWQKQKNSPVKKYASAIRLSTPMSRMSGHALVKPPE